MFCFLTALPSSAVADVVLPRDAEIDSHVCCSYWKYWDANPGVLPFLLLLLETFQWVVVEDGCRRAAAEELSRPPGGDLQGDHPAIGCADQRHRPEAELASKFQDILGIVMRSPRHWRLAVAAEIAAHHAGTRHPPGPATADPTSGGHRPWNATASAPGLRPPHHKKSSSATIGRIPGTAHLVIAAAAAARTAICSRPAGTGTRASCRGRPAGGRADAAPPLTPSRARSREPHQLTVRALCRGARVPALPVLGTLNAWRVPGCRIPARVPIGLKVSEADAARIDEVLARPEFAGWTRPEWCREIIRSALRYYVGDDPAPDPGRAAPPCPLPPSPRPPPSPSTRALRGRVPGPGCGRVQPACPARRQRACTCSAQAIGSASARTHPTPGITRRAPAPPAGPVSGTELRHGIRRV